MYHKGRCPPEAGGVGGVAIPRHFIPVTGLSAEELADVFVNRPSEGVLYRENMAKEIHEVLLSRHQP